MEQEKKEEDSHSFQSKQQGYNSHLPAFPQAQVLTQTPLSSTLIGTRILMVSQIWSLILKLIWMWFLAQAWNQTSVQSVR